MNLDDLIAAGFDLSTADTPAGCHRIRVRCSQCSALVINGTPCHEERCPNQPDECPECGETIPRGEVCTCMQPEDFDGLGWEEAEDYPDEVFSPLGDE